MDFVYAQTIEQHWWVGGSCPSC